MGIRLLSFSAMLCSWRRKETGERRGGGEQGGAEELEEKQKHRSSWWGVETGEDRGEESREVQGSRTKCRAIRWMDSRSRGKMRECTKRRH